MVESGLQVVSHGWLQQDPYAPAVLAGVPFDTGLPTRKEEYGLLYDLASTLEPGNAVDAGTGYVLNWHVAPYILGALGWKVWALDTDKRTMDMPAHPMVTRGVGDMRRTGLDDASADLVVSISVLEHVGEEVRKAFAAEAARIVRPGAHLLVTADGYPPGWLAALFAEHFDVGARDGTENSTLHPSVAYVIGRRR